MYSLLDYLVPEENKKVSKYDSFGNFEIDTFKEAIKDLDVLIKNINLPIASLSKIDPKKYIQLLVDRHNTILNNELKVLYKYSDKVKEWAY